jgi:predicted transcriptional regulator
MNSITAAQIICDHKTLSSKAIAVFKTLSDHSNKDNKCFPSIRRITECTGLSEATVHRAIRELLLEGLITREYNWEYPKKNNKGKKRQTSNIYTLICDAAEKAANALRSVLQMKHDEFADAERKARAERRRAFVAALGGDTSFELKSKNGKVAAIAEKIAMKLRAFPYGDTLPPIRVAP